MIFHSYVSLPEGNSYVNMDEAENRIRKKLGIEFKKGLNSNLIPTCLVFIDLKKGLNSNLIPTCLLFI